MDNEKLIALLMENHDRRRLVTQMAASITVAAVVHDKSEDEILNIMNMLIKAEIENHREVTEKFVKLNRELNKLFDDFIDNR